MNGKKKFLTMFLCVVFVPIIVLIAFFTIRSTLPAKYHLAFELLDDGTYEFVGINGSTLGKVGDTLEIPAEYEGKKVSSVDISRSHSYNAQIKTVKIADGIEKVVLGFYGYDILEKIELPASVKEMTNDGVGADIEVVFPGNSYIENIDNCLVSKKDGKLIHAAEGFKIPSSVKIIGAYAFANIQAEEVSFKKNIELIETCAFYGAEIGVVKISENVKKIERLAFSTADMGELQIESQRTQIDYEAFDNAKIVTLVFDVLPNAFPEGEQLRFDGDDLEWYYSKIPNEEIKGMEEVNSDRPGYKKYRF